MHSFFSVEVIRHLCFLLVVLSLISNHNVVAYEKTSDYFIAEIVVEVIESDLPKFTFSKCDSVKHISNTIQSLYLQASIFVLNWQRAAAF